MYIIYRLEAEKFTGKTVSRVEFREPSSMEDAYFLENTMTLYASREECQQHIVYINV